MNRRQVLRAGMLSIALGNVAMARAATEETIIDRTFPMLWNQVFSSVQDEVRPGRIYQYKVIVAPDQKLYINVISPLKQAYVFVLEAATPEQAARPRTRSWQGNVPGKTELTIQVWSEWQTDYILEVTRK
ncbi:hypothetical protein [Anthocerotibacter panamensis]|uniref:hypothetical protein n=1 Tax=Anthocerotibacter panamensis TaxID=2857077 RepID=UPI001C4049F2|nr:hypothetical protein [Anthocerotibacter panamensis]